MSDNLAQFSGSIPEDYDKYLGPMIFDGYANDLAELIAAEKPKRVLEVAAGTGILTDKLRGKFGADVEIVATDINPGMLAVAQRKFDSDGAIELSVVDACELPFEDNSFDAMACQFGLMFFPDKAQALREVRRVVKPSGLFATNVWGAVEDNDFVRIIRDVLNETFPDDPPSFYEIPFGLYDTDELKKIYSDGGFAGCEISTVTKECSISTDAGVAQGLITGSPMGAELAEMEGADVPAICVEVTKRVAAEFGKSPSGAKMQALVITARV